MGDGRTAAADFLRHWASDCHGYRVHGMEGKATELQCPEIRDSVVRVRRDRFFAVGVGEVDQRRCQKSAILPAIGLRPAWPSVTLCQYGVVLSCTLTRVAVAPDDTTRRPSSVRTVSGGTFP